MATPDDVTDIGVAINEANWHGIHVNQKARFVALGLTVLTMPESGPEPEPADRMIWLRLDGVSRIAASLRSARWDDADAPAEPVSLGDLADVLRSFHQQPIYGWDFVDTGEQGWASWRDRFSLDVTWASESSAHAIDLFQESGAGPERHLDLRVWFDRLTVLDRERVEIPLSLFIAGGRRWWDALKARDPRIDRAHGIVPAAGRRRWVTLMGTLWHAWRRT